MKQTLSQSSLRIAETNLKHHYTFERPPAGFEPHHVSDEILLQYGLPHRPDPKKFPKAARLWLRSMSRVKKFVTPKLTIQPQIIHGKNKIVNEGNGTSSNWSGLTCSNQAPYTAIWGNWIVPSVRKPDGGHGDYYSSFWVGLNDPQSLFQAGTEQRTTDDSYYAWFEWFPGPEIKLDKADDGDDFSIAPGQSITVFLASAADGTGRGTVAMFNDSTGLAITTLIIPIPTLDFNNNPIVPAIAALPSSDAVWILERPSLVDNGVPTPAALADFAEAVMVTGGAAGTNPGGTGKNATDSFIIGNDDQGTLWTMLANDGVTKLSVPGELPELVFRFTGGANA
ncbi:MAG: G1 family glutamic endopeptidase [Chitinophagales bacterium]